MTPKSVFIFFMIFWIFFSSVQNSNFEVWSLIVHGILGCVDVFLPKSKTIIYDIYNSNLSKIRCNSNINPDVARIHDTLSYSVIFHSIRSMCEY
jgi:hypothetical protein